MSKRQHTITALVQNEAGTLNRLVSLFRRRGFSLASLNAGDCEQPGFSRLTLVVEGDDNTLNQCLRQLEKLIDVVEVADVQPEDAVERELALVRVKPTPEQRDSVFRIASEFNARTPRASEKGYVVEVSTSPAEIERLIQALTPFGMGEVVRSGLVAMRV
ncbi:acetolactate synthase small subunit [Fimbriimonas ginsengisoli]|uniref:Acetolactate synthase small subunit n=1 Tax=Fimbriimonas ginsengisoli Gsoil 348 TaxID=661478 RepID=A0A068NPT3_FIMGI|nr:acetolactate synthase small subunit [Fimbriimonas ginsengisoli]AIE83579.1 acetolactate synthase small subunit [Fimbriimonas ginsengisoli Gsoil 348]